MDIQPATPNEVPPVSPEPSSVPEPAAQAFTMDPLPAAQPAPAPAPVPVPDPPLPAPEAVSEPQLEPSNNPSWSPGSLTLPKSSVSNAGLRSLVLGFIAVGIVPILVFFPTALLGSTSLIYLWIGVVIVLGAGGTFYGRRSVKNSNGADFRTLVGLILSVTMFMNAALAGVYYIKLQMTVNSFKSSYSNSFDNIENSTSSFSN